MNPILFNADETEFRTNGLGRISPLSCTVTEERNGQFELEAVVSIDDPHFSEIEEGKILYSLHDDSHDKQPFEIYKISRPLNGKVTVNAQHITYRTAKITVMPFTAGNAADAMAGLKENAVGDCPFEFWTDKAVDGTFSVSTPVTLRSRLAGTEGSLLDVYGTAEYEWDKFTVKLHRNRGSDTGVVLRYGKNITDLKKTTDSTNVWTGVCPYWVGTDETTNEAVLVTLPEKVIYADTADDYAYKMVIPLDLTGEFQNPPSEETLRNRAAAYIAANAAHGIPTSIDVSFIALWQTEEYKDVAALQRLHLCDTLTVRYAKLGVKNTAKIVKTVYNVLLERYDSMTIGESKSSLGSTIQAAAEEVKKSTPTLTAVEQAIAAATNMISGSQSGYVVINQDENGKPYELLAMNTADISTATNILRLDKNGIACSTNGYKGTFHVICTLAGLFSADFVQTGTMSADRVRKGSLASNGGVTLVNLDKGTINLNGQSTANGNTAFSQEGNLSAKDAALAGTFTTQTDTRKAALEDGQLHLYPSVDSYFYAPGTTSPAFSDIGEGIIGEDGTVTIVLEEIFLTSIEADSYQVFLQKYGDGDCYVSERGTENFTVIGTAGLAFGWEVKATQKGYSGVRLGAEILEEEAKSNAELSI